jgi:hypothetical protein
MRQWLEECTFKDEPDNVFHKKRAVMPAELLEPGGKENDVYTSGTFLGNLLKANAPLQQQMNGPQEEAGEATPEGVEGVGT